MAKIHITLVGGQPAPVYNGIEYAKPEKVVFIYSDQTKENANSIINELKGVVKTEKRKCDPVDLKQTEELMLCLAEKYKDEEVSVNISSGTKVWSYYFGSFPNAQVFYVDQNNIVWDFTTKTSTAVEFNSDVQFRLYGTMPKTYTNFNDYTDTDRKVLKDIIELQSFGNNVFFRLVSYMKEHTNQTRYSIEEGSSKGSSIEWDKTTRTLKIKICKGGKEMYKALASPHAREFVLKAGWFEYKVAEILSKWNKARDIWLNPKFNYTDGAVKNEIDIIVKTDVKFLFVEVKTQIDDNTDIDKFSSAVENFAGKGCKKLFVTQVAMSEKAIEKCNDNGVMSFSLENNKGNISVNNITPEQLLYMKLDEELLRIEA